MQVKRIPECSKGSILQYFRPSLSYHLSLRYLVLSIFEWPFYAGFTVFIWYNGYNRNSPIDFICRANSVKPVYSGHFQNTKNGFQGKKEGRGQESIQSSTSPDPGYQWESDNFTVRNHKREPRSQPFPSK